MLFSSYKLLRKITAVFGVLAILSPSLVPLQAGLFSAPKVPMPNANDFASDVEKRYDVNTESVKDQSQNMNVNGNKITAPQASIFFTPSDPEEGQKISARALPVYFATEAKDMYYTWYLQRAKCTRDNSPSQDKRKACDWNNDSKVNAEDWKIEAARVMAAGGFDANFASYGADTDNDGYKATFGGNSRVGMPNHCYFNDSRTGENYEILSQVSSTTFSGCTGEGRQAVCMEGIADIGPGEVTADATGGSGGSGGDPGSGGGGGTGGDSNVTGDTFEVTGTNDTVTGYPYCSTSGTIACVNGVPCCVADALTATACTQNITGTACTVDREDEGEDGSTGNCKHLFPRATGYFQSNGTFVTTGPHIAGDGDYGAAEERAWQTDPTDASTADDGDKDEANVVGLGQESFSWNFSRGDKVGVVVEGVSMITTKYDDSSSMIMWGFSKNKCNYRDHGGKIGSYQKKIKGYNVTIPTIAFDLNNCLEDNLVDPLEGGQATGLEVTLNATPNDPVNDSSGGNIGDVLSVSAVVNNSAQEVRSTYFDWKVYISKDGTANPTAAGGWENVNSYLIDKKILAQTKGNGLDSISLALNIPDADVGKYLQGGVGYLKFQVDAAENFSASGVNRRGKTDIVVKFISTSERIAAYIVIPEGAPTKLKLDEKKEICSGVVSPAEKDSGRILRTKLDAKLCRVIKNEIIGLKVIYPNDATAFTNFNWTINGLPLVCNASVSPSCSNEAQGGINFFPIIGNVGDVFTITVSATRNQDTIGTFSGEARPTLGEKTITLSRAFKIVDPGVSIVSADTDQAWPKVLGKYVDANGKQYTDYSTMSLQAFAGSTVKLRAEFTPDFLGSYAPPQIERSWAVDNEPVGDGTSNEISFATLKEPGDAYNVTLSSVYRPSALIRKALQDIWKISTLDSTEVYFKTETQLEHPEQVDLGKAGQNKYLALLSSYIPAPLLFSIRIFLSVGLIIFVTGFIFALIPSAPARPATFVRRR